MAILDRDVYLRNYVLGVLVNHTGKLISHEIIGDLATNITEAVIQGDSIWHEEKLCEEVCEMGNFEEDIPQ